MQGNHNTELKLSTKSYQLKFGKNIDSVLTLKVKSGTRSAKQYWGWEENLFLSVLRKFKNHQLR